MAEQNNVLQLKKLAAKIKGTTVDKINGCTIADILDIIQQSYKNSGGGGNGVDIASVILNASSDYAIKSGVITMSDGSTIDIEVSLIESLTLTAAEGSATGKTKITVKEAITTGNHYRYDVNQNVTPAKNEDLTEWDTWNGTDEITAQSGATVLIAECDANNKAVKCGTVKAVAPIF